MVAALAAKSRHYRERLKGIKPIFNSFEDLETLPFTWPADLADTPSSFVHSPSRDIERVVTLASSGTTAKPKRVFFSASDLELTVDFFAAGMSEMVEYGQTAAIFMGNDAPGGLGALLSQALARLGVRPVVGGPVNDVGEALDLLKRLKPTTLIGFPAQIHRLAMADGDYRPKSVLLAADYVSEAISRSISRLWACEIFEHYGSTESGFGGGVHCSAHIGYHLREADLLVEIVDPRTGRQLGDGQRGEVVFTTLNRQAMPLIRYRTGDLAKMLPAPCPCGSDTRRLGRIEGRVDGRRTERAVTIEELDEICFSCPDLIDYRVSYRGPVLAIKAELRAPETEKAFQRELAGGLSRFGMPFSLTFGPVPSGGQEKRTIGLDMGASRLNRPEGA
jgi:phenylacetate-coenzyme A ligase PaaK-like adenylate-forming protein